MQLQHVPNCPSPDSDAQEPSAQQPSGKRNETRVLALDGLRGLAILAVFLFHFGGGHYQSHNFLFRAWSLFTASGWMGVDLFFVLSGFLITGIIFDTSHVKDRVKNFYARRALRIFPLFYGVLFGFLLLTPFLHLHWHWGHLLYFFYLSNMTWYFTPNLGSPGEKMVIVHFWSLAVEEQFYLLWPFVVWAVPNRRRLLKICGAIFVFALLLRLWLMLHGFDSVSISSMLPTRADSLICGGALALLVRGRHAHLERIAKVTFLCSGMGVAGLSIAMQYSRPTGEKVLSSVGYTFTALFFTCLVYFAQRVQGGLRGSVEYAGCGSSVVTVMACTFIRGCCCFS